MPTDERIAQDVMRTSADLTIGEDFYGDDPSGTLIQEPDAIDVAVGSPAYIADFMFGSCREVFPEGGELEPETFDRYYFPPDHLPDYKGPAPCLIDILVSDTDLEQDRERADKRVEFKTKWCRERGVRYVVLRDSDQVGGPAAIRAKLMGSERRLIRETPAPAKPRTRGVQRPRRI
jgi:hypothetical protein